MRAELGAPRAALDARRPAPLPAPLEVAQVVRHALALPGRLLAVKGQRLAKEDEVRATTAFKRLLRLPGASVIDVGFGAEGVIVTVEAPSPPAGLLALRADRPSAADPRPAREALAPPGPRLLPLRDRVRAAPPVVPRLRRAL